MLSVMVLQLVVNHLLIAKLNNMAKNMLGYKKKVVQVEIYLLFCFAILKGSFSFSGNIFLGLRMIFFFLIRTKALNVLIRNLRACLCFIHDLIWAYFLCFIFFVILRFFLPLFPFLFCFFSRFL